MRAFRLRRRQLTLPVSPDKAVMFVRKVLWRVRLKDADAEDIASAAYLRYWRGFVKTGKALPASFKRDVLDAYKLFTGLRRKTPRPVIITNACFSVFDRAVNGR